MAACCWTRRGVVSCLVHPGFHPSYNHWKYLEWIWLANDFPAFQGAPNPVKPLDIPDIPSVPNAMPGPPCPPKRLPLEQYHHLPADSRALGWCFWLGGRALIGRGDVLSNQHPEVMFTILTMGHLPVGVSGVANHLKYIIINNLGCDWEFVEMKLQRRAWDFPIAMFIDYSHLLPKTQYVDNGTKRQQVSRRVHHKKKELNDQKHIANSNWTSQSKWVWTVIFKKKLSFANIAGENEEYMTLQAHRNQQIPNKTAWRMACERCESASVSTNMYRTRMYMYAYYYIILYGIME